MVYLPYLIAIFGVALRLIRLDKIAGFDYDQEVAAVWIKNLLVSHKFSLIGQEVSIGGIYIAPFFYYFLAPVYLIFNMNPIGANYFLVFVSGLTTYSIYLFGRELFGTKVGLVAAFLYAIHPGLINLDRIVAPSNLVVLISALAGYFVVKKNKSLRDYVWLGIVLGATFSVHPPSTLLIPVAFLLLRDRRLLITAVIIFLLVSPLIFFELRHGGEMTKRIFSMTPGGFNFEKLVSNFNLLSTFWAGIVISSDQIIIKTASQLLAVIVWLKTNNKSLLLLLPLLFLLLLVYPGHIPEYYYLAITPLALIFTVNFLGKYSGILVVLGLVILLANRNIFAPNHHGLFYKVQTAEYLTSKSPAKIYYSTDPGQGWGFTYLFWWKKLAVNEGSPNSYQIIIPASREEMEGQSFGGINVAKIN